MMYEAFDYRPPTASDILEEVTEAFANSRTGKLAKIKGSLRTAVREARAEGDTVSAKNLQRILDEGTEEQLLTLHDLCAAEQCKTKGTTGV